MANKTITATIKHRQAAAATWESKNPVLAAGEFGYDTTNKITKIGDGSTHWNDLDTFVTKPKPTFAESDWTTIAEESEKGNAQKYFAVGDEKTIVLTTGEEITLVILGFNHDDLTSGGKAGITIGMKELLATRYRMNSTSTNAGGWDESEMRTTTMQTLLRQLPYDLLAAIKSVNKKATSGGTSTTIKTSSDKLFLFSEVEIDGTTTAGLAGEGTQYEYWKTVKDGTVAADRVKRLSNGGGSANAWWLRSPRLTDRAIFLYVLSSGDLRPAGSDASNTYGVSFGFCI